MKKMVIRHTSFKHGWFYHYRVHNPKLDELTNNGLSKLKKFLINAFDECPHDYFEKGPRGSRLKFKLPLDLRQATGHEVCSLTKHGLEENHERFKSNHSKVQLFMLEKDNNTVAVEVPIWLESKELKDFKTIFNTDEPLTGHIDVLRVENNKVWVWDYKPNAQKEEFAMTQTYFYALMLSKRTGISLDHFRCGYFDSCYAFIFKPEKKILKENQMILSQLV